MRTFLLFLLACIIKPLYTQYSAASDCNKLQVPVFTPKDNYAEGAGHYHELCKSDWKPVPGSQDLLFWKAVVDQYVVNYSDDIYGGCNFQSYVYIENRSRLDIEYTISFEVEYSANCGMGEGAFRPAMRKIKYQGRLTGNEKGYNSEERFGGKFHKISGAPSLVKFEIIKPMKQIPRDKLPEKMTFSDKPPVPVANPDCEEAPQIALQKERLYKIVQDQQEMFVLKLFKAQESSNAMLCIDNFKQVCDAQFPLLDAACSKHEVISQCSNCSGIGFNYCNKCGGHAEYECPDCMGTGFIRPKADYVKCTKCKNGYVVCTCGCGLTYCGWCSFDRTGFTKN